MPDPLPVTKKVANVGKRTAEQAGLDSPEKCQMEAHLFLDVDLS